MDRVVMMERLTEEARDCLQFESVSGYQPVVGRAATRDVLADIAERLGFDPKTEISAAVDEALSKAGTTP